MVYFLKIMRLVQEIALHARLESGAAWTKQTSIFWWNWRRGFMRWGRPGAYSAWPAVDPATVSKKLKKARDEGRVGRRKDAALRWWRTWQS